MSEVCSGEQTFAQLRTGFSHTKLLLMRFCLAVESQCVVSTQIVRPRAESTPQNFTACSFSARESRVESTWRRLQINQRRLVKKSTERRSKKIYIYKNGRLFDSNESSVLSFDSVT